MVKALGKIRVVVADDHGVLLAGLVHIIDKQPDMEVVRAVANGYDVVKAAKDFLPDILLLDLNLPDISGIKVIDILGKNSNPAKIIVLTMHEDEEYLKEVMKRGAKGYLVKRSSEHELLSAIRNVSQGMVYVDPVLAGNLVFGKWEGEKARSDPANGSLSEREEEVLRLTALSYTSKEIAERLFISIKTVESHKTHIKSKLNLRTRAELVHYALKRNLIGSL